MADKPHPAPDADDDHRPDPAATVPANDPPEDPDGLLADPSATRPDRPAEDPKIEDEDVVRTREEGITGPKLS
jgi:hypothetical protein